jgi:pimeloyl-ACP methyl ester carboxylesterase
MSAERISMTPCFPRFARSRDITYLRPGIPARRSSLESDNVGRLAYYTNACASGALRNRPLVLLHGIHAGASAHELRLLFEAFRHERPVYAPDLPGFGSSQRGPRDFTPELYIQAIEGLVRRAAGENQGLDVVAVGLSCEYAAQAAVHLPGLVRSLTLISPTGFAVKREQGWFERASRRGKSLLPVSLLTKLGISPLLYRASVSKSSLKYTLRREASGPVAEEEVRYRYATSHQPGAEHAVLALWAGELIPSGNPQSVYTRVHCPTLILHGRNEQSGFGSLACFVKWHEYFSAQQMDGTSVVHEPSAQDIERALRAFWTRVLELESQDSPPGECAPGSSGIAAE